ncbi:cupin domain-containing protein [Salinarimonas rosea]|uniref:cupin domain-containing protein n=1 Tax=Salinarimonas rosea TaxID=552063 RepID=UPI0005BE283B|nr:cupin domain-containing protein [Salinarimonas rosea]
MTPTRYVKLARDVTSAATAVMLLVPAAFAQDSAPAQPQDDHVLIESEAFTYEPGPPSLAEGAEYSVLYGDPSGEGVFAMRLKLPDGYHIAPHFHGQPEIVTVISGTFRIGSGEEADPKATTALEPGGFFAYPPGSAHYAYAEGETVVQLNSTGPWTITYVKDEDDPRS